MNMKQISIIRLSMIAALLAVPTLVSCSDSPPAPPDAPSSPPDAQPKEAPAPSKAVPLAGGETWDIYYIQGSRVGYGRTTISHTTRSGRKVVKVEGLNHLAIKRFGQPTEQEIRFTSIETPDGKLIEFESEIQQGRIPLRVSGKVVGNKLEMETTTQGKRSSTAIPWSAEYGGFYATEESLLRRPMQPGERRTVRALAPGINQVATIELTAKDYEPVKLLGGTFKLLRIDTTTQFPGASALKGAAWCDRAGETLKTSIEAMNLDSFRATKALALEKTDLADLDLGTDIAVRVSRPLPRPHDSQRIRYRVQLDGGDPAAVFESGPSQQVKATGEHTAELTVYAIRPGRPGGNPDAAADPPTDDDRQPNNMIQSDDARIVADAAAAAGHQTDPWQVALALERYVHRELATKNFSFSQAFATAAEVAENRQGDCSENAVFLAALARARGIPARVAIGLVYMADGQAFGYHMWTEVYVQRRWIPLDATLGRGGIGAAHLKVAHSNLHGASAYSSFLPLIQVIGRLKIEIEEIE